MSFATLIVIVKYLFVSSLQIRIDFNTFVITGPSTAVASVGFEVNGNLAFAAGKTVSAATQCLTDIFTLTAPGGYVPPVICGTNSGQHGNALKYSQTFIAHTYSKNTYQHMWIRVSYFFSVPTHNGILSY